MTALPHPRSLEVSDGAALPTFDDAQLRRELLKRSIGNPFVQRSTALPPLLLIALVAYPLEQYVLMLALICVQVAALTLAGLLAIRAQNALRAGEPAKKPIRRWLWSEALTGAVWGLMIIPIADLGSTGFTVTVIAVTIVVSVTATCLSVSTALGNSEAVLGGFAATALPISFVYIPEFGLHVFFGFILFLPALLALVRQMSGQALDSLRSELEVKSLTGELERALLRADHLSRHDELTGLLNRRAFEEATTAMREGETGSAAMLLLFDLDHFKTINDRFGHNAGDSVLREIARLIERCAIAVPGSQFARWGGEEFIVALPGDDRIAARALAESLRASVEAQAMASLGSRDPITASLGISHWPQGEPLERALARADAALYQAKAAGRNCIREAGVEPAAPNVAAYRRAASM